MYNVKQNLPATAALVIRPSVTAVIVYTGLCSIWYLWILCTARFPSTDAAEPFRLISASEFALVTTINGAFIAAFAVDGLLSRRSPPGLRVAHLAGLLLAVTTIALVQLGAFYAYGLILHS